MAKQRLQQCLSCGVFGLLRTCPNCGGDAQAAAPLKWSPEDHRAGLRRKMNHVESPEWPQRLPTLPSAQAMEAQLEEE